MRDESDKEVADLPRRKALAVVVAVGCTAYAAALAAPAVAFVTSTGGGGAGKERWIRVAKLADLPEGQPRRIAIVADERDAFTVTKDQELGAVWATRKGDAVQILSATCPHLGCAIDLAPDKTAYACPCHASKFALTGAVEGGPSPRAMDRLAARIVDGAIEVDFRRFRQGVPGREETGA